MKKQNVYAAIVGGGAAGLMCAVRAAEKNPARKIVIIERADRVGKKLLVTGNGRCNLSHLGADSESYHGEGSMELVNILFEKYNPDQVIGYFRTLGLLTHADREGRVYPLSNQASSVLDVLRKRLAELSVEELCGCELSGLQKNAKGYEIVTADRRIFTEKLVIAVGGKADYAGRESGSEALLHSLGLAGVKLTPSLSPVKVHSDLLRSLKGVRADGQVTLMQNGKVVKSERGEIQFTDNALSGICVFNLSREANRGGGEIAVNLLPGFSSEEILAELTSRIKRGPDAPASEIFTGMFHKAIGLALLKASGVKPSESCNHISNKELNKLCLHIVDWRFPVEKSREFKKAQVTAGGIRLTEIDPHTFETKKHRGLFVIGEALDIDGDCGGYNLQFAFASGMCAGESL